MEIHRRFEEVSAKYSTPPPGGEGGREENIATREAHTEIEMLRCDIELSVLSSSQGSLSAEEGEEMDRVLGELSEERLGLHSVHSSSSGMMYLRVVAVALAVLLIGLPLKALVLPMRVLHPLFRACGLKNNFLPLDYVTKWFARFCLLVAGIRVMREGLEELDLDTPCVGMFSHASNLDPFILQSVCPIAFKWIGKSSIFAIPIFGWISLAYGHIPIDRSNRERAIASLDSAVRKIKRWERSIAISPEGTRSKSGLLKPFKKGAFHMVADTELPIMPAVMFGNYERWPPGQMFTTPGVVTVRFLPRISFPKGTSTDVMRLTLRKAMLTAQTSPPPYYLNKADRYMSGTAWGSTFVSIAVLFSPLAWYFFFPWASLFSAISHLSSLLSSLLSSIIFV